jgi:hypothetical protein
MNNNDIFDLIWLKFWFQQNFRKEIVFESSVLAWIPIRIRNEQKCWIRIRIKSIRIHNPAFFGTGAGEKKWIPVPVRILKSSTGVIDNQQYYHA